MDVTQRSSNVYLPNGVMTIEVGVIHGELWVSSIRGLLGTVVTVGYVGSPDVHTVLGSPIASRPTHEEVILELTRDRGTDWQDLLGLDGASPSPL